MSRRAGFRAILRWMWALCACVALAQSFEPYLQQPILSQAERTSMMYSFVERNLPPIDLPKTRESWETRKAALRVEILALLGLSDIANREPLRWSSKGVLTRNGYTIEKIIYESYPGMWVSGLVYVPRELKGTAPAMLSIPGHWYCDGKAHPDIQARNVNLVRRGFIVFTYDYIGTFERNSGSDPCAAMPYGGANDHGLRSFSYTAGNPTGLEIRDAIRAMDYLFTRDDVDRARIGVTGESGGSNSTYWLAAIDDRVQVAVPVASVTSFEYWIRNDRNWDWHQRPTGIRRIAEISTLLAMFAPKPLLAVSSVRGSDSEEFPLDEAERAVEQARSVYQLYGAADRVQIRESSTAHGYQQDKRELMYGWVTKYLAPASAIEGELPFQLEPRSSLVCGLPKDNQTLESIYADWLARSPGSPQSVAAKSTLGARVDTMRSELRTLLGLSAPDEPSSKVRASIQLATSRGNTLIRRLLIQTAEGIWLPALELTSRTDDPVGTVVVTGKSAELTPLVEELLRKKLRTVLVDLRGTGEIESGGTRTDNWAWMMGRPWPGMWVEDLSGVITALGTELSEKHFGVIGVGKPSRAALFLAALDSRVEAVFAEMQNGSYTDEAKSGELADIPRILSWHDWPDVAGMIAPRACWIRLPAATRNADAGFAWSKQAYQSAGAPQSFRLQVSSEPDWTSIAEWLERQLARSSNTKQSH